MLTPLNVTIGKLSWEMGQPGPPVGLVYESYPAHYPDSDLAGKVRINYADPTDLLNDPGEANLRAAVTAHEAEDEWEDPDAPPAPMTDAERIALLETHLAAFQAAQAQLNATLVDEDSNLWDALG